MHPARRLALGSTLAVAGGATVLFAHLLGWTELARPWSFIIGFSSGLSAGIGVPLCVCGLARMSRR